MKRFFFLLCERIIDSREHHGKSEGMTKVRFVVRFFVLAKFYHKKGMVGRSPVHLPARRILKIFGRAKFS